MGENGSGKTSGSGQLFARKYLENGFGGLVLCFKTDEADYDKKKIGWQVQLLDEMPKGGTAFERRKIYDTTQPGRGNQGHTFGDHLTDAERWAVIEYLKAL